MLNLPEKKTFSIFFKKLWVSYWLTKAWECKPKNIVNLDKSSCKFLCEFLLNHVWIIFHTVIYPINFTFKLANDFREEFFHDDVISLECGKTSMTSSFINTKSYWGILHSFHIAGNCASNNNISDQQFRVNINVQHRCVFGQW